MILMRHGQSHFNVVYGATRRDPGIRDPGLTEKGQAQVAAAAKRLRDHSVRRIVASPYTRALETAEIVASVLGLRIQVEAVIGERAAFTCDVGTPRSDLLARWPHLDLDHIAETWWPDMDESEEALDRRCRAYRQLLAENGDWPGTLIVTHWGVIRTLTGHRVENADLVRFDPTAAHPGGGSVVPPDDPC
jgi:broad specificity phosphatase PhoE